MRIITGKYKGRHFEIPRSFKARPTTDFAKENIFNVLNGYIDFEDATALDLFSGTGSITLEPAVPWMRSGHQHRVRPGPPPLHTGMSEKTLYWQYRHSYPRRCLPLRQVVQTTV